MTAAALHVAFAGGDAGAWRIERQEAVAGPPLAAVARLQVLEGAAAGSSFSRPPVGARWVLRGATARERYTTAGEHAALAARSAPLGRPAATRAALIPVRKSPAWWSLGEADRRAILEERSRHIAIGLDYAAAIARRLHHARDLGEPFDFLTWFEFAPADAGAFDELVARLRGTEEWTFVEREVDLRLARD